MYSSIFFIIFWNAVLSISYYQLLRLMVSNIYVGSITKVRKDKGPKMGLWVTLFPRNFLTAPSDVLFSILAINNNDPTYLPSKTAQLANVHAIPRAPVEIESGFFVNNPPAGVRGGQTTWGRRCRPSFTGILRNLKTGPAWTRLDQTGTTRIPADRVLIHGDGSKVFFYVLSRNKLKLILFVQLS